MGWQTLQMFVADGNTPMIVGGSLAVGMMALLNMLFVMDAAGVNSCE